MDEEVKDSTLITLSIISIITLICIACGLVAFLLASDYLAWEDVPPADAPVEEPVEEPAGGVLPDDGPVDASGPDPEDLERWQRITLDNVETGCLIAAKDEAGDSASLVYGCSCQETASSGRKTYGCEIDTADPFTTYFANIDCFLADAACSIETNYGTVTLTFEEMDEWYG